MGRRRDLSRLSHPTFDPVHSTLDRRIPVRAIRHAVRIDPHLSDHSDHVFYLAVDGLFQDDPVRARGMRADRRRKPLPDPHQDRPAVGGAGTNFGLHLLLHAVLERIHLRAHLHFLDREQDGTGSDRQRIRGRRYLSLGFADGRRAGRLAATGDPVCLLRRTLRLGHDGRGQGIGFICIGCFDRDVNRCERDRGDEALIGGEDNMDLTVVAYATLALSLFVSAVKVGGFILNADPPAIINSGRWALLALAALALAVLAWLIGTERWAPAMMLAAFMLPVFVQAAPRWRVLFGPLNPTRAPFAPSTQHFGRAAYTFSNPHEAMDPELCGANGIAARAKACPRDGGRHEGERQRPHAHAARRGAREARAWPAGERARDRARISPPRTTPRSATRRHALFEHEDQRSQGRSPRRIRSIRRGERECRDRIFGC